MSANTGSAANGSIMIIVVRSCCLEITDNNFLSFFLMFHLGQTGEACGISSDDLDKRFEPSNSNGYCALL